LAWTYFDTSVLGRGYFGEPGRAEAMKVLRRYGCITSVLTVIEFRSAVRRRVLEGALDDEHVADIHERLAVDREGWGLVELTGEILSSAEALAAVHPLRTLDAIHVASALLVFGRLMLETPSFITADRRQAEVARAVGLRVVALT
jgi:predicted nucleic acid-binding protein